MTRRGAAALRLALVAVLGLAAACASSASGATVTDHVDLPRSYLFRPADITVTAGTTVSWTNSDQFTHSVRLADGGRMVGVMKPGESVTYLFERPGVYRYDCSLHPQNMKGTVTVTAP